MAKTRLLFVDDEVNIRFTLPRILESRGFEVSVASTVPEALAAIHSKKFDVLLSDLNVGSPGDGFTIVSAMRRTQPEATTLIITGFPAFETALEAIRMQVDDYILKPADIDELIQTIAAKLREPHPRHEWELLRIGHVLRGNLSKIQSRWLLAAKRDPELLAVPLSDQELADHLPRALAGIIAVVESPSAAPAGKREAARKVEPSSAPPAGIRGPARQHGETRLRQGYTIPMLVQESRLLQAVMHDVIQENLLHVDVSWLIPDLKQLADSLEGELQECIEGYLSAQKSAA